MSKDNNDVIPWMILAAVMLVFSIVALAGS